MSPFSASGAVTYNRASTTCAKAGYDGRFFTRQKDPIVAFGQPQSAHNHNFFGALLGDYSTYSAGTYPLRAGHEDNPGYQPVYSNCPFYSDWPLGWYPVAKLNGVETSPSFLIDTWQTPAGTKPMVPPFGTSFVSGSAAATVDQPHVRYTCGDGTAGQWSGIDGPGSPVPHDCTNVPGGVVTGEITFPNCWDGLGATRPDPLKQWVFDAPYGISTSHFYYADANGNCPPGTVPCVPGKLISQLVTQESWIDNRQTLAGVANPDFNKPLRNPLNPDGTMALSFASGDYKTYHGDYINTWNMDYLAGIAGGCLQTVGGCPYGTRIGLHNLE